MMEARDEYIQRCFRHQWPELYGRDAVGFGVVVAGVSEESHIDTRHRALGPMEQGNPIALALPEKADELQAELSRARDRQA